MSLNGQFLERIKRNAKDIFYINDWQTYLTYSNVTDIIESQLYIYFSTNGAGILRYDKFNRTFSFPLTESNGLISNVISEFSINAEDSNSFYIKRVKISTNKGPQAFQLDQDDNYYFREENLNFYNKTIRNQQKLSLPKKTYALEQPYTMTFDNIIIDNKLQTYRINGEYRDKASGIWLFVENLGFFYSSSESGFLKHVTDGPVSANNMNIVENRTSLYISQQNSNSTLPSFTEWTLDGEWNHWSQRYTSAFRDNSLGKIVSFNDSLYIASNFGLIRFDTKRKEFTNLQFQGLSNVRIYDIFSSNKRLLLGTERGLYAYYPNTGIFESLIYPQIGLFDVLSVAEDSAYIFAVNRFSVYKINKESGTVSDFNSEQNFPSFLTSKVYYNENKFWFNNNSGIYSFDTKTGKKVQIYLNSASFILEIKAIKTKGNSIFLATNKGLLFYSEKIADWLWISQKDGLIGNNLNDLLIDGDFLIISSNSGVQQFYWNNPQRKY
jgi:ligand-binding sensor domain-containing protein